MKKPEIQKNVNLASLNSMGVEAVAGEFIEIRDHRELAALYENHFFSRYSPLVLGGGSNMLLIDNPLQPVIKISIPGVHFDKEPDSSDTVLMRAGAGENWHQLVHSAVELGYGGIENLALIPGTAGAAPIQNIGAYGVELEEVFVSLTALNTETGEFEIFEKDDCKFAYRDSVFKRELKGKRIITEIKLRLTTSAHRLETGYSALSNYLEEKGIKKPATRDIFDAVVSIRQSKLPDPKDIGNAGSFFKNPIVDSETYTRLLKENPGIPSYEMGGGERKIPAAWLIDQAGWKGKQVGNVGTFKNQALVLVNMGGATGREIYDHAMRIRDSVKSAFGVDLQPEVNIIGQSV
ncbi:UDP-N-acetylmuramate dehydrogenase [Rhodohalobacter sp. SW132]|nr:UDP-N-acetylmuramate dehydrogenase [Rhodohalobacter sp. SW132]